MAGILLQPYDDHFNHPAYRRVILYAANTHATQSERYGSELELTINSVVYKLLSRKKIYSDAFIDVYELDLSSLLQDLLTYNLHGWGLKKDQLDTNCRLFIEGELYDWNVIAGVAERDTAHVSILPFLAHNTCLQHHEYYAFGSGYYHTMDKFSPRDNGTTFQFLTYKPNNSQVCLGDSEYLPVMIDDVAINGVRVRITGPSGDTGLGMYYLQSNIISGLADIKNPRRSIGVGPANINGTTWDSFIGVMAITSATIKYTVELGFVDVAHGIFILTKKRTYFVGGACCDSRERIFFINTRGGMDVIAFENISEAAMGVKSTAWEENTTIPFDVKVGGDQRLNSSGKITLKYSKFFEENEILFMNDFVNAVLFWKWNGVDYMPVKIKDETFKVTPEDDGALVEFQIEYSNDYLAQRN